MTFVVVVMEGVGEVERIVGRVELMAVERGEKTCLILEKMLVECSSVSVVSMERGPMV